MTGNPIVVFCADFFSKTVSGYETAEINQASSGTTPPPCVHTGGRVTEGNSLIDLVKFGGATAHWRLESEEQPEISQRELARALGVSLGKSHYLLKALLDKGLVKANNFRRSDNKLAYAYLLTPNGIAAKLELTRAFLRLKEVEYQSARDEIERLRKELGDHHA